ncbi:hypothetical protein [Paenibacillus woosongensis]|uniref:Uncharacterized protein n=1 Tax=Paenibacillus woosongensis TaxID=307580 RepID=A0A7X2Z5G2_9BACL|nr:hypothetical protein [Paenibacillus woosongensis]MUG47941.1 hypothetical protein [Paenibacillus woosongensis]
MRTINTPQDVDDLLRDGTAPAALAENIAEFFRQLKTELVDDEEDPFRLDQHGPIILLEAEDDLRNLNFAELRGDDLCRTASANEAEGAFVFLAK